MRKYTRDDWDVYVGDIGFSMLQSRLLLFPEAIDIPDTSIYTQQQKKCKKLVAFKLIGNKICCIQEMYITCKSYCIVYSNFYI